MPPQREIFVEHVNLPRKSKYFYPQLQSNIVESLIKKGYCAYCKTAIRPIIYQGPHQKTKARYCPNCGAQIWTVCDCGANLRYEDRFCSVCGSRNPIYLGNDPDYYADRSRES